MKNTILAALVLAVAAPAFAGTDKLAASVGVDAGSYTVEQLVQLKGQEGSGNGGIYLGESAAPNATATAIFVAQDAEEHNAAKGYTGSVASRSASNPVAEGVFSAIAAE